jgi:hypothetical protein
MTWLSLVIGLAVVAVVANAAFRPGRLAVSAAMFKRLRPVMFVTSLPVIAATIGTAVLLFQVPWLQWGWYALVSGGHQGNVMISALSGTAWLFLPFLALLAVAMPHLVRSEEVSFREGTVTWAQGVRRSVGFGLMHLTAGVPIAAGLALTIAGLWYTHQYMRGGIERSTSYHLAWNLTIMTGAAVLAVAAATA